MNSFINKPTKELFIIKLSMESKWVAIVRERFEEKTGRLNLGNNIFSIDRKEISDSDIPDIIEVCQGVQNKIKELYLCKNINI